MHFNVSVPKVGEKERDIPNSYSVCYTISFNLFYEISFLLIITMYLSNTS